MSVYRRITPAHHEIITLREAMAYAIAHLDGQASVSQVREYVMKKFKHREWSPKSIGRYFYYFSKPQTFQRVSRGIYTNAQQVRKERRAA